MGGAQEAEAVDPAVAAASLETDVRAGESVTATCPYCGRPFVEAEARNLHVGERHGDTCSVSERDAYETARDAERDALFYFHLRVVAALGVLYAVTVLLYMIALGSDLL